MEEREVGGGEECERIGSGHGWDVCSFLHLGP
jgi:hypothetical protein